MAKLVRIATVKATGKQYLVNKWIGDKVYCWGEVASYQCQVSRGEQFISTRHEATKTFLQDFVEITEVPKTKGLIDKLWHQGLDAYREKGHSVRVSASGKTATISRETV